MGTPLKVSDELYAVAKKEAKAADRSATAQVEHWAKIGRAVEAVLAHEELLTLKKTGELLRPVFPSATRRKEVHDLLARVAASEDRRTVKAAVRAKGQPIYAADPDDPEMVVQVDPDGTRTRGRIEGRRFVPADRSRRTAPR